MENYSGEEHTFCNSCRGPVMREQKNKKTGKVEMVPEFSCKECRENGYAYCNEGY